MQERLQLDQTAFAVAMLQIVVTRSNGNKTARPSVFECRESEGRGDGQGRTGLGG